MLQLASLNQQCYLTESSNHSLFSSYLLSLVTKSTTSPKEKQLGQRSLVMMICLPSQAFLLFGGFQTTQHTSVENHAPPIHTMPITKDDLRIKLLRSATQGLTWAGAGGGGYHSGESKICNLEMFSLVQ